MALACENQTGPIPDLFYVGGDYIKTDKGTHMTGQMCVRHYGKGLHHRPSIVYIHGAAQTGTHYEITPDGRPGLALLQAAEGWDSYVVDLPGVGRSRYHSDDLGPLSHYTAEELQSSFTAPHADSWASAKLHSQWPGAGTMGDALFDAFYTSQVGHIADYKTMERLVRRAARSLLSRTGPAYLVTHSQSGPLGWHIADECGELVRGIVALEPHGPPFEYPDFPPFNKRPEMVGRLVHSFGITSIPLCYEPALPDDVTHLEYEVDEDGRQEEGLARGCRLKEPGRVLRNLASVPVVVVTAEASYHAGYDHLTVQFLRDAGVRTDHIYLADVGIHGNGHLMAIERNNTEIQKVIDQWLRSQESRHKDH